MVKRYIVLLCAMTLFANQNLFDKKCEACHQQKRASLKKIFFDYLLYYSSERRVKQAMREQLLHPDPKKSPLHKKNLYKHSIDSKEVDLLLQIYWNRYKVIGKIK